MSFLERRSGGAEEQRSQNKGELPIFLPSLLRSSAPPLLCFALALTVRLIGLHWGLPDAGRWYSYHPDESTNQVVGAVGNLLQGDFNPHFFNYPSLTIYVTWLIYQFMLWFGLTTNAISPAYPWPVVHDVILAGRLFTALCGAATAPLVWATGKRLGSSQWAILAGVLAALAPGHVQHSHFATVDVPSTFFVTLCLYLTLRATDLKGLLWAGLVAGLAAGTKYNAGLVLVAPLWQAFALSKGRDAAGELAGNRPLLRSSAPLLLSSALAFFATTPYALLDPHGFWGDANGNGFYFEAFVHPKLGSGDLFTGTGLGWWYHFSFNLPFLLTWPLVVAALGGIGFAAKKREFWPLLVFTGLFFLSLGLSQVRFMRYLLPIVPLLCLLAAYGASRLPLKKVWGAVLIVFALWGTKDVLWPLIHTDPRDQAAEILKPYASNVATANIATVGNPWFYTPPFQPQGFNRPVAGITPLGLDAAKVLAAHPPVFVISEYDWRENLRLNPGGEAAHLLQTLEKSATQSYHFDQTAPVALPGRDFEPTDYLYTHPETRVYLFGRR